MQRFAPWPLTRRILPCCLAPLPPEYGGAANRPNPAYNDHLHSRDLTSDVPRDERERLFNNWGVDVSYLFWVTLRAKLDQ